MKIQESVGMQNRVMMKRSANMGVFLLLLSILALGNMVTGTLDAQDFPPTPTPQAAALLSRSYMVEHLDVETAAVQVRQALDPREARVFIDRTRNQVVIKGTAGAHQLAAEMFRTIDRPRVSSPTIPIPAIRTARQLRCYLVTPNNVGSWTEELNRRYAKVTGVRITPDVKNGQITVVAPVAIHEQLGQLLAGSSPPARQDDWQLREQQTTAIDQGPSVIGPVVPATQIEERKIDNSEWLARVARQRAGAFPVARTASKEEPASSEEPPGDLPVVEAPLPQTTAPLLEKTDPRELETGKRKIVSAFPRSRGARSGTVARQPSDASGSDTAKQAQEHENDIIGSLKKDIIGGVKSIDDEFRSLHDRLTRPVVGFFESVQEDISISVTDLANTVSKKLPGNAKAEDSKPRAAQVIRVGVNSKPTPPKTPAVTPTPPKTPAVTPKPVEKPAFEVVPFKTEPEKPVAQPLKPVVPVPSRKVNLSQPSAVVPPAPHFTAEETKPSPKAKKPVELKKPAESRKPVETKKDFRPVKPAVVAKPSPQIVRAPLPTPTVTRRPVTRAQSTPVKPASQLVEMNPAARPPARTRLPVASHLETPVTPSRISKPARITTRTIPGTDAPSISLVGASDKEIVEFVARHLRMQEAGELAGCEIRMMLQDRQVWFILERENGTMVRLRVGEIKLDREGKGVLVVDPEKLQR
jgi:hypothetical protein